MRKWRLKLGKLIGTDNSFTYYMRRVQASLDSHISSRDISDLAEWLEWPEVALRQWVHGIPDGYGYDSYRIRKRSGRGYRYIDAPNDQLKSLQKRVYHKLLKGMRPHTAAKGFVPDISIVDNAIPHVGQAVVISIDLKDFFSNISANRVYRYWYSLGWDVQTATALENICCYKGRLPQGAPTSPALSNVVNYLLDARLHGVVGKANGQYTRYADDLTFSFPDYSDRERGAFRRILQVLNDEDYEIQKRKRIRVQRAHHRQITTGLVVNTKVNLPRETRRRIRAMQHHRRNGKLSEEDQARLAGYEALQNMVRSGSIDQPTKTSVEVTLATPTAKLISILFLAANPTDSTRLRLDEESKAIDSALRQAEYRDRFSLIPHWAVGIEDLQSLLLRYKPDIVHFCGHGDRSGIILEDKNGQSHPVTSSALGGLFRVLKDNVRCVMLNACYSEEQAQAISEHVSCVIGMSNQITDDAAINFAQAFYQAIGYGRDIRTAFDLGCNQIDIANLGEYQTPMLIAIHENPDQVYLLDT